MNFTPRITASLSSIDEDDWDRLNNESNPFLEYHFLSALEQHSCLEPYGWEPQYLTLYDDKQLIAAAPGYIKHNSYGELVFDWAWADAYQRMGMRYYPKLVIGIPYTPAQGERILSHPDYDREELIKELSRYSKELVEQKNYSSVHWLFMQPQEMQLQQKLGFLNRRDCQFHWHNYHDGQPYQSFDDFLARFSSKKRKNIKQERRKVRDAGIELEMLSGDELTEHQWQMMHQFYRITFVKKSGYATLSLEFFKAIADKVLVAFAKKGNEYVAAAIFIRGQRTLYGRHWGCFEDYDSLHFELCYYQGIDYCIEQGLEHFEPGAQGEHKITRGFEPTQTCSSHWLNDEMMYSAVRDFVEREKQMMQRYCDDLKQSLPFKKS